MEMLLRDLTASTGFAYAEIWIRKRSIADSSLNLHLPHVSDLHLPHFSPRPSLQTEHLHGHLGSHDSHADSTRDTAVSLNKTLEEVSADPAPRATPKVTLPDC